MTIQTFVQTLITAQTPGPILVNSTVATSLLPGHAKYTLPANYFTFVGQTLRFTVSGAISTVVTTPGTLTLAINFGTLAVPIAVFSPPAIALNVVSLVGTVWFFEAILTCRSVGQGVAATTFTMGKFISRATLGAPAAATTLGVGVVTLPDVNAALGTGFDSTITNVIDLFATWSIANANNSIVVAQYSVESLN